MKPFGRDKWVLGKHQNDPEVAKLNVWLRQVANLTVANAALVACLLAVLFAMRSSGHDVHWQFPTFAMCYALYYSRYLRKRALDLHATFDESTVGTNLSRSERSDADTSSIVLALFMNGSALAVVLSQLWDQIQ